MVTPTDVIDNDVTQVFDLPQMKLLQPTSPEITEDDDLKAGKWYVEIMGQLDAPNVVPVQVFKTRRLDNGDGEDYEVLCESFDGITGLGTPGGSCVSCDFAQWQDNPDGGRNFPPDCGERILFVLWLPEYQMPAVYAAKGSAMRIANKLRALMNMSPGRPIPLKLGAQMKRTKQYTWFVPTLKVDTTFDVGSLPDSMLNQTKFELTPANTD